MERKTFVILLFLLSLTPFFVTFYVKASNPQNQSTVLASLGFIAPAFHPNQPFLRYSDHSALAHTPHPGWNMWQKGTFVQTKRLP